MKIQLCYKDGNGNPTKIIREFDGSQCCQIIRSRNKDGSVSIGIKRKSTSNKVCHVWKFLYEVIDYKLDENNEEELILKYVVES
jgi:hypothetical protein